MMRNGEKGKVREIDFEKVKQAYRQRRNERQTDGQRKSDRNGERERQRGMYMLYV